MQTALIQADNICVTREKHGILNDVSLRVGAHDFMTIIGPNGAGKSMLLKCLLGFYPPDSGTVHKKDNLSIGYLPQHLSADPSIPISAKRFIALHKKTTHHELQETAELTGIVDILEKPLWALSGGELQRVLLARALLGNPQLLVLDEPAQNLDISGQLAFYKLIERIYQQRGISILMVSHDLHLVMASTKQVVCLYHHICCSGTPQMVTKDPEFIALFGDDMANMMAVYHHEHSHTH